MVPDTQAVPTLFIYHPCYIDLMVTDSLLSSCLLKHVPANKKEERQRNDILHSFKGAFQKSLRTV